MGEIQMKRYTEFTLAATGLTTEWPSIVLAGEGLGERKLTCGVGQKARLAFPRTERHVFHFYQ